MQKKIAPFFKYLDSNGLFEKKSLIKIYYYKYLIVSSSFKLSGSFSVENFNSLKKATILPKSYYEKSNLLAYSLSLKEYKIKSVLSFNNSFEVLINFNSFKKVNALEKIKIGFTNSNKTNALFLLSTSKGGYNAYCISGIKGFLPRNQILYSLINKYQLFYINLKKKDFIWIFFKTSKVTISYKGYKENICSSIFLIDSTF
jgi:hypothetical protein